jgi:hypothetical protein
MPGIGALDGVDGQGAKRAGEGVEGNLWKIRAHERPAAPVGKA